MLSRETSSTTPNPSTEQGSNSNANRNRTGNQPYGYHNTFHLHAIPSLPPPHPPPTYDHATSKSFRVHKPTADVLPRYKCTLHLESQLGVKCEMTSPFMLAPPSASHWHDVYAVLHGTQLRLYRLKSPSHINILGKSKPALAGRLLKSYSMQHAEVGLATDVKKSDPVPRSTLGKLIPAAARAKVFETDPHLFEPIREHMIRLRLETEQFLLSASTAEEMLDWVESLCTAIDISMPLEDRSEPRYRSLPRRNRRQEGRSSTESRLSNLESRTALVRQQERIMREMYPHLAADDDEENPRRSESGTNNPDADDLDPEDAMIPSISVTTAINSLQSTPLSQRTARTSLSTSRDIDTKPPRRPTPQLTPAATMRYRRRCAPILLASSPRASDVIIAPQYIPHSAKKNTNDEGTPLRRVKVDMRRHRLQSWETLPPKYEVHPFA
ncbi:hypothetical protein NA57DRAFT_44162, partial [Rhizodiscina lignyota]